MNHRAGRRADNADKKGASLRSILDGFGLHSAALTAKELGGTLTAFSAGTGQGAKFTLELPIAGKKIPANLASNKD